MVTRERDCTPLRTPKYATRGSWINCIGRNHTGTVEVDGVAVGQLVGACTGYESLVAQLRAHQLGRIVLSGA